VLLSLLTVVNRKKIFKPQPESDDINNDYKNYSMFPPWKPEWQNGNLEVPAGVKFFASDYWKERLEEPILTKRLLFEHVPDISDVKQSEDVTDTKDTCYFLSTLMSIIQSNSTAIGKMMKDLGDGYVAVRFYRLKADENGKVIGFSKIYVKTPKFSRERDSDKDSDENAFWVTMMLRAYK
jgi:hypothetical protein